MSEPFSGFLIKYGIDGAYLSPPVALQANLVLDEAHGWVIEIILPHAAASEEHAVLLPLAELEKIRGNSRPPS